MGSCSGAHHRTHFQRHAALGLQAATGLGAEPSWWRGDTAAAAASAAHGEIRDLERPSAWHGGAQPFRCPAEGRDAAVRPSRQLRGVAAGAVLRSRSIASQSRPSRSNGIGAFSCHCDFTDDATGSNAAHVDYTNKVSTDDGWHLLSAGAREKYHTSAYAVEGTAADASLVGARFRRGAASVAADA